MNLWRLHEIAFPDVAPHEAAFDALVDATPEGAQVDYRLDPPRWWFLHHLVRRGFVLHGSNETGIELAESVWSDVVLTDCRVDLAGFRHAKLERVVFRDCRLEEADFAGAALTDVMFERCELRRASFAGVRVERVQLSGCELTELVGVESLRGARMPWNDVLQNAPLFAQALGIRVLE